MPPHAEFFRRAAYKVAPCASEDEARENLRGVRYVSDGTTIKMMATDGHRLAILEEVFAAPCEDLVLDAGDIRAHNERKGPYPIPRVVEAKFPPGEKILADLGAPQMVVKLEDVRPLVTACEWVSRLKLPRPEPKPRGWEGWGKLSCRMVFLPESVSTKFEFVSDLTRKDLRAYAGVGINVPGPDVGCFIDADQYEEDREIGVDPEYLAFALWNAQTVEVRGPMDPLVFRAPGYVQLVMPVRL